MATGGCLIWGYAGVIGVDANGLQSCHELLLWDAKLQPWAMSCDATVRTPEAGSTRPTSALRLRARLGSIQYSSKCWLRDAFP